MTFPILTVPDPRLRQVSIPVRSFDTSLNHLVDDMLETMYAAHGIGLSAPQIGILRRLLVVDIAGQRRGKDSPHDPLCMANPEILWTSSEPSFCKEGCLSLPDQYAIVKRPSRILVRYLDSKNHTRDHLAEGLLATVIQHEMDHLEGVLFVDYLSRLRRDMITRRMRKMRRTRQTA